MEILIKRTAKLNDYTIGNLYIDDQYLCNTLEDTDRGLKDSQPLLYIKAKKIFSKTAIPTGTYKVELTYSPRFKRVLPLIVGVKGFDGIRIHQGNFHKDTEGCILVGKNTFKGGISESKETLDKLLKKLEGQKDIYITIK